MSRGHQQQRETCSDEVPTLHTSGLETLNSGKLALTTQLIKKTIFDPPPPPLIKLAPLLKQKVTIDWISFLVRQQELIDEKN